MVDLLNQAVARDPSFFQAYCRLVNAHDRLYFLGLDHTPARLALAEEAVQAASRLRPNAGETHLARAENLYQGYLDYDGALAELELARPDSTERSRSSRTEGLHRAAPRALARSRCGVWSGRLNSTRATFSRSSRSRSATECSAVTLKRNRSWIARWPSSPTMPILKSRLQPSNFIGKPIPNHGTRYRFHPGHKSRRAAEMWPSEWFSCALAERDLAAAKNAWMRPVKTRSTDYTVRLNRPLLEGVIARMVKDAAKHDRLSPQRAQSRRRSCRPNPITAPPCVCWV